MNSIAASKVKIIYHKSVDKDIQSVLLPLNIMQTIFFCPKYRIKNNIIHVNSRISNLMSICGTTSLIALFLFRLLLAHLSDRVRNHLYIFYIISYYDFCFNSTGCFLNCFLTIVQVNKNIEFVLITQRVHRFLNNKKYLKFFNLFTWLFIVATLVSYIFVIYYFYHETFTLIGLILISFDVNVIYAIRCLTLLRNMLDLWNKEVLHAQLMKDMDMKDYCKAMFQTYTDILSGYNTLKSTFKHFVSNITF